MQFDSVAEMRYWEARVEGAKTLGDSYDQYDKNPEVFVAGVQYALDRFLKYFDDMPPFKEAGHVFALTILERAKAGQPQ